MKITATFPDGKPQVELEISEDELQIIAPVAEKWADLVKALLEGDEKSVHAVLDAITSWMQAHPALVKRVIEDIVTQYIKSQEKKDSKAMLATLLAMSMTSRR